VRTVSAAAVLLVALTACAGPREDLKVGVSEVASDIVLGAPSVPPPVVVPPAPVPPNSMPLSLPGVGALPEPPPLPEPAPHELAVTCPSANPLSVPKLVAPNEVTLPPAPASYVFRNDGTYETSGANATRGRLPATSTRAVQAVTAVGDGTFTYDVRAVLGTTATTTSYLLKPGASGGVWITKIVTQEYPVGTDPTNPKAKPSSTSSFDPTPDLQLLAFPIQTGDEVTTRGADASTGQVVGLRSVIKVKARVDACGEFVDTQVAAIDGEIGTCPPPPTPLPASPPDLQACNLSQVDASGERDTFSGEYRFATQFGGLVVQDSVDLLTERPTGNVSRKDTAAINRMPLPAVAPHAARS
jgi:hypothetical protein